MIDDDPDVALTCGPEGDDELVAAVRRDGEIVPVATADAGRLELFREGHDE